MNPALRGFLYSKDLAWILGISVGFLLVGSVSSVYAERKQYEKENVFCRSHFFDKASYQGSWLCVVRGPDVDGNKNLFLVGVEQAPAYEVEAADLHQELINQGLPQTHGSGTVDASGNFAAS